MRDVNNGWLIRYFHSNTASAFFFLVESVNLLWPFIFTETATLGIKIGLSSKSESSGKENLLVGSNSFFSNEDLFEWFRGFVDAEGCFFIQTLDNRFKFVFTINLHKDEYPLLKYLAEKLGVGNVYLREKYVNYTVSSKGDLLKIFAVLGELNTSKNLNYIMFKKAYDLYFNRESLKVSVELRERLIELKNQMNKNRIDFNQPKGHSINITPYWLLGFVEGDGYFSVNPKTFSLKLGIGQATQEIGVLEEIKTFLLGLPGKYRIKRKNSNLVKLEVYNQAKGRDHRPMTYLTVNQTDFLTNVLIPFFDNLRWLSKKEKDYEDWRLILNIIKQGKHFTDEGKNIISLIAKGMNNNRLSTNLSKGSCSYHIPFLGIKERILKLIESPLNYKVQPDGKILIKSLGTYLKGRGNVGVRVLDEKGELVYNFSSIKECALFFNLHSRTINRRLENGTFIEFNGKNLVFKREVYLP